MIQCLNLKTGTKGARAFGVFLLSALLGILRSVCKGRLGGEWAGNGWKDSPPCCGQHVNQRV